jgi:hypothetical protein
MFIFDIFRKSYKILISTETGIYYSVYSIFTGFEIPALPSMPSSITSMVSELFPNSGILIYTASSMEVVFM